MTAAQLAIISGLIGTATLIISSYSVEPKQGSFFAKAVKKENQDKEYRNRWRHIGQTLGFAILFFSYLVQWYALPSH